jgi:solute carrier family 41
MLMVIPGHIIFIYTIRYMKAGNTSLTPLFVMVYLVAATVQVPYCVVLYGLPGKSTD